MVRFLGLIPELPVSDVAATLDFYRDLLGFTVEGRHEDDFGEVTFGSVLCGEANFYFTKTDPPQRAVHCWVCVDDVESLFAALGPRGVRITSGVESTPWGYRQFTIEDPNGHRLSFFQFDRLPIRPCADVERS